MICQANQKDYSKLLDIQLTCIGGLADTYSKDEILAWTSYLEQEGANRYNQYENRIFVDEEGQGAGFVSWSQNIEKLKANIECLYVLPHFRNKNIGSLLLREAEMSLSGGTIVSVRSTLNAEPFYVRHDYRQLGRTISRAGFSVILLEKILQT